MNGRFILLATVLLSTVVLADVFPFDVARSYEVCLAKRPAEELYDMKADPWQVRNLANESGNAAIKRELQERLEKYLGETGDPRMRGENPFDFYPLRYRLKEPLVPRRPES